MRQKKKRAACCLGLAGLLMLTGCARRESGNPQGGLVLTGSLPLEYATQFSVEEYQGGYTMLSTAGGDRLLVVPEGKETPEGLDQDVAVVHRPVENLYLVASAAMDLFDALDAVSAVTLSGQKEEGWYIQSAREAMARGDMVYAGKYDRPDYELILSSGCTLAIENKMIFHAPEVIERLEEFGVPVVIDCSSYESHPLGRVEWVKFYGALLGREKEAEQAFARQAAVLEEVAAQERTDKTVAFFFITANGLVQVRRSGDYVPKMIELAGGKYCFDRLGDGESALSTVNLQVEEFYDGAKDADFLIYNSSIDGGVSSVGELLDKCPVLEDFAAVREGNVWCTTNDMYQQTMSIGDLILDIHRMLQGEEEGQMRFLFRLK